MKINKTSSKLIKPQTPTPSNLKNYHVSFLDLCVGTANVAIILYYKSNPDSDSMLEASLAKILVQFYPLAGRYIKNDLMVDCSDQGAEIVTAEALDLELIDVVGKIKADQLEGLVPDQHFRVEKDGDDPILSIQVTHFQCGGAAIAITVPHRVFDAASLGTFVTAWSDATNPDRTVGFTPSFDLPSLLPKKDRNSGTKSTRSSAGDRTVDFRRLMFNEVALTSLKSKIRPKSEGKTISGVRVVTAVLAEALIRLDRAKHGRARDFVVIQPVNIRGRTVPPQPKHSCGNFFIPSTTRRVAVPEAEDMGVEGLVGLIGDAIRRVIADHADILSRVKDGRDIIINSLKNLTKEIFKPETSVAVFTDWSKFGFYEADFGWGKPVWTSPGPQRPPIDTILVMSNEGGYWIEAWVYLDKNDMRCFEEDEVFKLFVA